MPWIFELSISINWIISNRFNFSEFYFLVNTSIWIHRPENTEAVTQDQARFVLRRSRTLGLPGISNRAFNLTPRLVIFTQCIFLLSVLRFVGYSQQPFTKVILLYTWCFQTILVDTKRLRYKNRKWPLLICEALTLPF